MFNIFKRQTGSQEPSVNARQVSDVSDNENSLAEEDDLWEHLGSLSVLETPKETHEGNSVLLKHIFIFVSYVFSATLTNIHIQVNICYFF